MSQQQTLPCLLNLPPELHLMIRGYLDAPDFVALRNVSKAYRGRIPEPTVDERFACERMRFAVLEALFYCSSCRRLRHERRFPGAFRIGRYAPIEQQASRVCSDCLLSKCVANPNSFPIQIGDQTFLVQLADGKNTQLYKRLLTGELRRLRLPFES